MELIIREIILSLGVIIITVQSSSLIRSLLLVPLRAILILAVGVSNIYSGFMSFIFIIIFIGGLIVLLVSVASVVQQEQGIFLSWGLFLLVCIFIRTGFYKDLIRGSFVEITVGLMHLLDEIKYILILFILFILFICLFVVTKLLIDYKGLIRTL